ncbi:MAG: succinate dehydrogenase, hydrophobic membrane anchor protein, partial [Pseudomonadota bacterium]
MTYKWEESQFKAPLARARGLGSAHSGVHHWMHQKITALANIPLSLWAVWSVTKLAVAGMTYENVFGFLVQPFNAVMMLL